MKKYIIFIINYVAALLLVLSLNSCRTSEVFDLGTLDCPPFSVMGYKVKSRDIRMWFWVTFYFDRKGRLLNYQYNNIFFSDGKDDIKLGDSFNPSGNYQYPDSAMKYINMAEPFIPLMQMVRRGCKAKLHKVNKWETPIMFVPRIPYQSFGEELYKCQDYWKKDKRKKHTQIRHSE